MDPQFRNVTLADLRRGKEQAIKDAEAKRQGKLSSLQKKLIAGGVGAAVVAAAYTAYRLGNSGEARRSITKGKAFVTGQKDVIPWKDSTELADPKLDADGIFSKVVKKINPHFGQLGTNNNCRRCTFAYELRRRGKDVAATRATFGSGQHVGGTFNALYPGEKMLPGGRGKVLKRQYIKDEHGAVRKAVGLFKGVVGTKNPIDNADPEGIFHVLSKLPNASRGELGVIWDNGGGHSVAWEIVHGKPVIFDTQAGEKFTHPSEMAKFFKEKGLSINKAGWTRLDNVDLNEDFLLRWLKNAR
jgi:hypothetical protein